VSECSGVCVYVCVCMVYIMSNSFFHTYTHTHAYIHTFKRMCAGGKSGSGFYVTHDHRFFLKSLRRDEFSVLSEILPELVKHFSLHPPNKRSSTSERKREAFHTGTFLPRIVGCIGLEMNGREDVFIVMTNLLPKGVDFSIRYDLKGSLHGRTVGLLARRAFDFAGHSSEVRACCMCVRVCVRVFVCVVCVCECAYVCLRVLYVCASVCTCVCVCVVM
jgi:hypothetical protein